MSTKPAFRELAQYLEGELTQSRAAEIAAQLSESPEVRAHLQQVQALIKRVAEVDPSLESVDLLPRLQAAIARDKTTPARPRLLWVLGAGLGLGVAAVLVVLVGGPLLRSPAAFHEKGAAMGTPGRWAGIEAYQVENGHRAHQWDQPLHPNSALAFSYRNGGSSPFSHLAVFSVDEKGDVFWYYPAWERSGEDPSSVSIQSSETAVDLPDAIQHAYAPGRLHLHALFTRHPFHVSELEAILRAVNWGEALQVPDATDHEIELRVEP